MATVTIPSQRALDAGATPDPRTAAVLAPAVRAGLAAAIIYGRRTAGAALALLLALLAGPGPDDKADALDRRRCHDEPAPSPPVGLRLPAFPCAP